MIAAAALLAAAHTGAYAQENTSRIALEQHACAVVMGLHQPGDLYDTCISSLEKSLSEADQARSVEIGRSKCSRMGLLPGTSDFAICELTAEQNPAADFEAIASER